MSISEKRLSTTGRRMKYCRKIEKLKLSELADKIDVPIFILKSYETDKKQLPYELARRIANVLHTTAGYLLGWEADPLLDPLLSDIYRQKTNEEALLDDEYDDEPFSDIDDDWDEENESISLFYEMMYKSEEEKDEIIETGAFNAHIAGYLIYTLQQLGCSASTITKARQLFFDEIVPNITAETARELGEATKLNKLDSILNKNNVIHFPTED